MDGWIDGEKFVAKPKTIIITLKISRGKFNKGLEIFGKIYIIFELLKTLVQETS